MPRDAAADTDFARRIEAFCNLDASQARLIEAMEEDRLSVSADHEDRRRRHAEDVSRLKKEVAARDNRLAKLERELNEIKGSRGYQALEQVRNVRRKLRSKR